MITDLEAGTFAASGTMVRTTMIEILRPRMAKHAAPPCVDDLPLFAGIAV